MQLTSPKWFESGGARPCPIRKRLASFIRMSSWGLFLTLLTVYGHGKEPADRRPNLLLILADDMGYSDLSSYGGEIGTPNIDSLAREGLLFTQFYNNAKCAPTRASLLTGLYHHQSGIHRSRVRNDSGATIAELLQQAGYTTMMVGNPLMTGIWRQPEQSRSRGFDLHFSFGYRENGPGSYFDDVRTCQWYLNAEPFDLPADFYNTDSLTDYALQFLIEAAEKESPFFLYVSYMAPHWPLHARPVDISLHEGVYRVGWDEIRARRHKRLRKLGLIEEGWKLSPRHPGVSSWQESDRKEWQAERMAVYAAQISSLDRNVGRILRALKEAGIQNDTLILFLSDNGASAEGNSLFRLWKFNEPDENGSLWRRDGVEMRVGNDPAISPGPADTFASYGPEWANVSNTPFRHFKRTNYEGGISTPLIVRWPGNTPADTISSEVGHIVDILPTFLDAAGVEYSGQFRGRKLLPLEGMSLVPVLKGGKGGGPRTLYWEYQGHRAVRKGKWKLVGREGQPWELYDMEADRTELRDLAGRLPQRIKEMDALYRTWYERAVAPYD